MYFGKVWEKMKYNTSIYDGSCVLERDSQIRRIHHSNQSKSNQYQSSLNFTLYTYLTLTASPSILGGGKRHLLITLAVSVPKEGCPLTLLTKNFSTRPFSLIISSTSTKPSMPALRAFGMNTLHLE